jgi:hypothetical protein
MASPSPLPPPPPPLEQQKLALEIESLRRDLILKQAETHKTDLESEKLRREIRKNWISRILLHLVPQMAGITALLVAGGSVLAVQWNRQQERARQEAQEFQQVVAEFASPSSAIRAGAAAQLGYIACCGENVLRQPHARALLLSAVGVETEFNVRHNIQSALVGIGKGVSADVAKRELELATETEIAFGRGRRPTCSSFKEDLPRIRSMEEGLLLLSQVASQLTGKPLELSNAPFRCALFLRVDLRNANLHGVIFWQADLTGGKLNGADITDGEIDATDLSDADISGVRFCGTRTTGLNVTRITSAKHWEQAWYPEQFARKLKERTGKIVGVCRD